MKILTAKQQPSGNWFIQLRIKGQSISITEPTEELCVSKAMAVKAGLLASPQTKLKNTTVGDALTAYINARENVLSPSTIRGYKQIKELRFKHLQTVKISELSRALVQREISKECALVSPKSVKSAISVMMSAVVEAGGERIPYTTPKVPPKTKENFLTVDQIETLLKAAKGYKYEIPILLGLWSLRRSEILALKWGDVDLENKQIHIRRGRVFNADGEIVEKDMPKTAASVRTIPICQQLYDALSKEKRTSEYVVPLSPNTLFRAANTLCEQCGLPKVGIHGLRHSFASLTYHLRIPPKVSQSIGGWENDAVMLKIYTHLAEKDINDTASEIVTAFDNMIK